MTRWQRLAALAALAAAAVLCAACGAAPTPLADAPAPVVDVRALPPISLPRDDAPHDNLTEWWYVSGHLETADGDQFGFEFAVFQSVRRGAPRGFAAHFAVTDIQRGAFTYGERTAVEAEPREHDDLDLEVDGWSIRRVPGGFAIDAALDTAAVRLELIPTKPAALHHHTGLLDFSPYGWSYYYSYTRMTARGVLVERGMPRPVAGTAWLDHQWGDFISVSSGGWDWFSAQLDDGRDFTASVVRGGDGAAVLTYGTLVDPDGRVTHLADDEFQISATDHWTSPATGAVYPSGWTVDVPGRGLRLEFEPYLRDQELDTRRSTGVVYWEGAVQITADGQPAGKGYVELTGYAPNPAIAAPIAAPAPAATSNRR